MAHHVATRYRSFVSDADPTSRSRSTPGVVTRRAAVGTLAAAGAGFALFGPRGARENVGRRLVLDYWEKWTGHEGAAMQRVVDRFNDSQDRLFVRYFVTSAIDQKSLVAIAGGDPPDVIGLWNFNVPPYAESGAILPLDQLAPAAGLSLDQYQPGVRQVMTHRGQWWATTSTAGTLAMYFNKSLFRAAGLDPDHPPRTIEELDAAHDRLTVRNQRGEYERVGFLHTEPGWWSWIWGYHFGGSIYDEAHNRALIDSPRNLAAYRWMQSYPRSLGMDRMERFRSGFGNYGTPQNAFLTGKVAMVIQGPWLANMVQAFAPDLDYGVAPFPVAQSAYQPDAPVSLIDTDVLVIPRGAKRPEASMEFIAFTQRQDVQEELATAHCKGSPLVSVSDAFLRRHPNRGVRLHNHLAGSPRAFICPPTRAWKEFKDGFDSAVQRLWALASDSDNILSAIQRSTQTLLDRTAAQAARRHA
ncbi:MAG: ABC transporter substrate-binding protein [Phycisphaerales bacterium]